MDRKLGIYLMEAVRDRGRVESITDEKMKEKVKWFLDLPDDLFPEAKQVNLVGVEELAILGKRLMKLFNVPKKDPTTDKIDSDAYQFLMADGMELEEWEEEEQFPELCLMAMVQEPGAFMYVKNKTPELSRVAVALFWNNLKWVKEQTPELCFLAAWYHSEAIKFIKDPVIQQQAVALMMVKRPDDACYLNAVYSALQKLREKGEPTFTTKQQEDLDRIEYNAQYLEDVDGQTEEFCIAAVKRNYRALCYVNHQTSEICMAAVLQDGAALQFVEDKFKTPELCIIARMDGGSNYVKDKEPIPDGTEDDAEDMFASTFVEQPEEAPKMDLF